MKQDFYVVCVVVFDYHETGFIRGEPDIQVAIAPPSVPVGKIKSFGPFGPKYEVGHALHPLDDGDWMIEVTIVETGEKAEYRLTRLSDDPEAH